MSGLHISVPVQVVASPESQKLPPAACRSQGRAMQCQTQHLVGSRRIRPLLFPQRESCRTQAIRQYREPFLLVDGEE